MSRRPSSSRPGGRWAYVPGLILPALALYGCFSGLQGQTNELSVEIGASSIRPPQGVEGDAARYLVAGIQALRSAFSGTGIHASFLFGRALDDMGGGDFYSGAVDAAAWKPLGSGWSVGLDARGLGFHISEPFPYRALAVEGGPSLRFTNRHLLATLSGVAGRGWSRTELRRQEGGAVRVVEDDLWRYGGKGELLAGTGRFMAGIAAGIHESLGGTYRSAGFRVIGVGAGPVIELRLDLWDAPSGKETIAGVALVVPWRGWSMRGFLGRTEPDPLTLAEPSAGAGGVMVGRRILGRGPLPPPPPPLHEILDRSEEGARVRIRVEGPAAAQTMEIMGDFTFWEPVTMERADGQWVAELRIAPGTYHFGFMADGEWFLPEDVPDLVSDDWGRKNATLVIEG